MRDIVPPAAEVRQAEVSENELLDQLKTLKSQEDSCKWEFGRIASLWHQKFARGRTDADLARAIGDLQQNVNRRRLTWEKFGESYTSMCNLSWTHFQVATGWGDATDWLKLANEHGLSVDEMKRMKAQSVIAHGIAPPEGQYETIVMDPPWPMQKTQRDTRPNQLGFDYHTLSEEQIAARRPPVADSAHVFVWTTHKFLPTALGLTKGWGLKYVCTFVWHKPGGFQPFGLPQYNCEFCLYCRHGSPEFIDLKDFPVCFDAPRGRHSEKPEEFYGLLRRVTREPRLDMYSRRSIDGFDSWGNEAPSQLA